MRHVNRPRPLADLRLGVFLNMPVHERDGRYTARYPHLFDFFLGLGDRTAETMLLVPLKHDAPDDADYGTVSVPPSVRVVGLPHWSSARMVVRRIHRIVPATVAVFARQLRRADIVGAVAPSVVGTIVIGMARLQRRPVFLLVRGEKQRTVRLMLGDRHAAPYVIALRVMDAIVKRWIRAGVPAFVAGHELVERYAAPRARVYDLYPALSREFPLAAEPRQFTEEMANRPLRLVTVARLSGEKGIDDLLRAIAMVRDQGVDVELEVVGDGPLRGALESLAGELAVTDRVRLAGFVPHGPRLVEALDRGDVFVLPSHSEGLPHSVVEAMARALPVLATEVGGLPVLLRDGNGVLVPVGDPAALATAIGELAGDGERLKQLSERSLAVARRMHPDTQLEEFCRRLAEAYPQVVALPVATRTTAAAG